MPYKRLGICLGETDRVGSWDVGQSEELTDDLACLLRLPVTDPIRQPVCRLTHKERHGP